MYREIIKLLQKRGVKFEAGMSNEKLIEIERIYDINFPESLRSFFAYAIPVGTGFYNWRDTSPENVSYIRSMIAQPMESMHALAAEVEWCETWGKKPEHPAEIEEKVRKELQKAPKLIPVFAHRYIPVTDEKNPPVISIHGTDVIYYGENLLDYFEVEFGEKKQEDIDFQRITPIVFWSNIM